MAQALAGKLTAFCVVSLLIISSLIAIMLGRLHMTVDECIEYYQKFMGTVFKHGWFKKGKNLLVKGGLYNATTLELLIKDLLREKLGRDDVNLLDEDDFESGEKKRRCKMYQPFRILHLKLTTDYFQIRHGCSR